MDLKKYFSDSFFKKVGELVYSDVLYPALNAYVQKTSNQWDDQVLATVDAFIKDFLKDDE